MAIAAGLVAAGAIALRPRAWSAAERCYLGFVGLGLFLKISVYSEAWAYSRVLIALPVLGIVIAERQQGRSRRWLIRAVAIAHAALGANLAWGVWPGTLAGRNLLAALQPGPTRVAPLADASRDQSSPAAVLYLLPVAHFTGRHNAAWRTQLSVTNLAQGTNEVAAELFLAGHPGGPAATTRGTLGLHQYATWNDAVAELFATTGAGVLRLSPRAGPIAVTSHTFVAGTAGGVASFVPAECAGDAIRFGESRVLRGLSRLDGPDPPLRTNLGLFNPTASAVQVDAVLADTSHQALAQFSEPLLPLEFRQLDDVLARAGSLRRADATVRLTTPTRDGAFFAYASVVDGSRLVCYTYPEH